MSRNQSTTARAARMAHAFMAVTLVSYILLAVPAGAVSVVAGPTTTISSATAGATAQYTIGVYKTVGNEAVTGYDLTFPAGFDISNAQPVNPAGSWAINGQTISVTLTNAVPKQTEFSIVISGVVNPAQGTYDFGALNVYRKQDKQGKPIDPQAMTVAPAVIGQSTLSITLSTSAVHFELRPGETAPPQSVSLAINSSLPYSVSRTVTGDGSLFGLTVTGQAQGSKAAGSVTLTDAYTADVPWTTEADVTYDAQVIYTIVQQ